MNQYKFLKLIHFKALLQWDLKRHFNNRLTSKYDIVSLENHILEQAQKYSIDNPDVQYGILGVNNQNGIFDAYIESGKNIKQKYKKMEVGWIAYNPYRVNVGSIGIKRIEHKYDYISPAYVVFSCLSSLCSDYLFLTMKTAFFSQRIKDNTTGSVRQNLSYEILKGLQIPLPSLPEQQALVSDYNAKINQAENMEKQAKQIEQEIEDYLFTELGIEKQTETIINDGGEYKLLKLVRCKNILEWGFDKISEDNKEFLNSTFYTNKLLMNVLLINPSTKLPKRSNVNISFIPMECISDKYGEWQDHRICHISNSNGYTKFQNGDLIWARITPCMQNGKSAVVDNLENGFGCGSTEFHILRSRDNNINMKYIHILLRLPIVLNKAMKSFTGSAGQQRVPKSFLEHLSVPFPPLDVQNAIVNHINALKTQMKKLKQKAEDLRKQALDDFEKEIFE